MWWRERKEKGRRVSERHTLCREREREQRSGRMRKKVGSIRERKHAYERERETEERE